MIANRVLNLERMVRSTYGTSKAPYDDRKMYAGARTLGIVARAMDRIKAQETVQHHLRHLNRGARKVLIVLDCGSHSRKHR